MVHICLCELSCILCEIASRSIYSEHKFAFQQPAPPASFTNTTSLHIARRCVIIIATIIIARTIHPHRHHDQRLHSRATTIIKLTTATIIIQLSREIERARAGRHHIYRKCWLVDAHLYSCSSRSLYSDPVIEREEEREREA